MEICSDLFSSTQKFQLLEKKYFKLIKKKLPSAKIIDTRSKYFKKNKNKFEIYWGNRLDLKTIKKLKNLKWIHYAGTGMNLEILRYAKKKKIKVTNTKRIFDKAVASIILSYIFMLSRGIHYSFYLKYKNKLNRNFYNNITDDFKKIFNQHILFVGYSGIAKTVTKVCHAMDMKVYAIRNKSISKKSKVKFYKLIDLKKIIRKVDYVINLLPYTNLTKNIFNKSIFNLMKKNSIFINAGRGDTVNEKDLINAIKKKKIYAAGLDVVKNEPIKYNSPLLRHQNIVITPHIAGINNDFWNDQINLLAINLKRFVKLKKLINLVDLRKQY